MKNLKSLFILTLVFLSIQVFSQDMQRQQGMSGEGRTSMGAGTGTLKGKVIDESDNLPVEYANVILYSLRDSSLVTGGITDKNGDFIIEKVPYGRYNVDFKFIGYNNFRVKNVMVNPRTPEVVMETIKLKPSSENIEEVVVTGQKSMLQHNLDKTVINVDRNINAEGGTALDIMRNIPSVEVDVEGNLSLRGSSNLTILVDGRPSQIVSLEELPANMVQSVELITNPSVRYDPDGLSGILNIVLVKKKTPGYHGMVSLNAGTGNKYSGTINLNVRQGKINYFANFDYRLFNFSGTGIFNMTSTRLNSQTNVVDTSHIFQDSEDSRGGLSNNLRGGVDYFINSKNTLSLTASTSLRNFSSDEILFTDNYKNSSTIPSTFNSNSDNESKMNGFETGLNYKKTFDKPGQEITADIFFSKNSRISDELFNESENSVLEYKKAQTDGANYSFTFQSDLVKPVGNGGRIETGIKGIVRKQDADYILSERQNITLPWTVNSDVSNRFILTDQIYAGYLIYSNTIGSFSYQAGIRVEDQIKDADQETTDSVVNVSFFNVFPSAHIKWDVNKTNALQVSYSRRVNRPSPRDLNPFINTENRMNISYGNPWLEPEYTDAYEIGHSLNLSKTSLNSTLFYRYRTNLIARKTEPVDSLLAVYNFIDLPFDSSANVSYPLNLQGGYTFGVEFLLTQKITKWWRVNGNFSYYKAFIDDQTVNQKASESLSWTVKLTSSMSLGKNLELQLNGNYRSPVITGIGGGGHWGSGGSQGKSKEIYSLDLGLRYMVMKDKGTITLRVSDIFNTRKFESDSWGDNFTSYQKNLHESRVVFLGFSYRINDYKQRREKQMDNMDDFENGNQ